MIEGGEDADGQGSFVECLSLRMHHTCQTGVQAFWITPQFHKVQTSFGLACWSCFTVVHTQGTPR